MRTVEQDYPTLVLWAQQDFHTEYKEEFQKILEELKIARGKKSGLVAAEIDRILAIDERIDRILAIDES